MTRSGVRFAFSALASVALAVACMNDAWIGAQRPVPLGYGGDAGTSGTGGEPVTHPEASTSTCKQVLCAKGLAACGNCIDDDGDGKIDMDDPECLSPCQAAENTFANPRVDRGEGSCVIDCYFDLDNGIGNDDCVWSHKCDMLSPEGEACAYAPNERLPRGADCNTAQSAKCLSVCGPLVPNGCDCFGCCKIADTDRAVYIGSVDAAGMPSCDLEHINDDTRCKPCTPHPSCFNPCDNCELCFGRRTLPASCTAGAPTCPAPSCSAGTPACGEDCLPSCPDGRSCVTGCCAEPPR